VTRPLLLDLFCCEGDAMEMPWASWNGCREAIPPAYTKFIGEQLIRSLTPVPAVKNTEPDKDTNHDDT
jgi:hypothetical protein